jgi:hypothetical protein
LEPNDIGYGEDFEDDIPSERHGQSKVKDLRDKDTK